MTRTERVRYEMFLEVRDFGASHADQFPASSAAGKAFAIVTAAIAAIERHAISKVVVAEEGKEAKAAVRVAIRAQLHAIARTARADRREHPDARLVFPLPAQKSDVALLTAARAFIGEGQAAIARFVPLGLPATAFTDLQTLVDRFDQADRGRRAGQIALAAAQDGITHAVAQGTGAVQTLDVIIANTFAGDAVQLGVWKRARHWTAKAAASARPAPEPPAPGPSPEPPAPQPEPPAPDVAVTPSASDEPGAGDTPTSAASKPA